MPHSEPRAGIGDNSGAFDQTLDGDNGVTQPAVPDDQSVPFIYAQWYVKDYLSSTKELTYEVEGAYIRFLMNLYDRGKPLPDDDAVMARIMRCTTRVWRRLKEALAADGKLIQRNGALTNARFEKERQKRATELRRSSEAATARWARVRKENEIRDSLGEVLPKFAGSLAETSGKLPANEQEKPNKNNESTVKPHMPFIIQSHIKEERESKALQLFAPGEDPEPDAGKLSVNGTKIGGPGFTLSYDSIDLAADRLGRDRDQVREDAKVIAQGWIDNGLVVKDPFLKLVSDLKAVKAGSAKIRNYRTLGFEKPEGSESARPFFWELYPLKVGKGAAFDAWAKLSSAQRRFAYEALVKQRGALAEQAKRVSRDGRCCCPHPATWLNEGRWEDQSTGSDAKAAQPERTPEERERREKLAELFGLPQGL